MSTNFCPQYISFKMNGLTVKLDNLTIHSDPNTIWVRFCGTPCSIQSFLFKENYIRGHLLKLLNKYVLYKKERRPTRCKFP